jgi:hypothetical protein
LPLPLLHALVPRSPPVPTETRPAHLSAPALSHSPDSKQVTAAAKKQPNKGGIFFPLTACQRFDAAKNKNFENGVFLGPIASLTFNGPYAWGPGRQLSFDVHAMSLGLGPWRFSIPLKKDGKPVDQVDAK